LVATGFLGAFTTFSTMAVETVTLIHGGDAGMGFLYLASSMTLGLVAAYAGVRIARRIPLGPDREAPC
jgi:CrcB protein